MFRTNSKRIPNKSMRKSRKHRKGGDDIAGGLKRRRSRKGKVGGDDIAGGLKRRKSRRYRKRGGQPGIPSPYQYKDTSYSRMSRDEENKASEALLKAHEARQEQYKREALEKERIKQESMTPEEKDAYLADKKAAKEYARQRYAEFQKEYDMKMKKKQEEIAEEERKQRYAEQERLRAIQDEIDRKANLKWWQRPFDK